MVNKKLDAYVTKEILEEYSDTIAYLQNKYNGKHLSIPLAQIISACHFIETTSTVKVCRDADDDKFISCALDANCICIVSGDKDLLSVGSYQNIAIMTVAEFLEKYGK